MRTFIAINLPQKVKNHLELLQNEVLRANPKINIKMVKPRNLHLTLQFIGEISELDRNTLIERLSQIIKFTPFELQLGALGCFPNHFQPRVIYVSAEEPTGKLFILQKKIQQFLLARRYKIDARPFKPHLTLGRLKYQTSFLNLPCKDALQRVSTKFPVHHIDLMQSTLTTHGPIYKVLAAYGE